MVGLVMLTLVPGEVGGSETYVRRLARALAHRGSLEITALVPTVAADAGDGLRTQVVAEYRVARRRWARLAARALTGARRRQALHRRMGELDAVHYPLTVAFPRLDLPTAVTVHDTLHLDLPQLFSRAERLYRARAYDRSARDAQIVITPSVFVRDRVRTRLGVPGEQIRVIHHGVEHDHTQHAGEEREPFVLYPARPWPHKNHARLFEAHALLRRQRPDLRLVLTGGGDFGRVPEGVEARGLVPRSELSRLYQRAQALVFPSLYEGFGQPPLEAMAAGCPVAAARAASLPEICGDAARLFDPYDPTDIAAALRDVLDAPEDWRQRGLDRAAQFTWDACAAAHEEVYRELLAAVE